MILEATICCPNCGHEQVETMPQNACVQLWLCPNCRQQAGPAAGDCCVFCTHANQRCPPEQEAP